MITLVCRQRNIQYNRFLTFETMDGKQLTKQTGCYTKRAVHWYPISLTTATQIFHCPKDKKVVTDFRQQEKRLYKVEKFVNKTKQLVLKDKINNIVS